MKKRLTSGGRCGKVGRKWGKGGCFLRKGGGFGEGSGFG